MVRVLVERGHEVVGLVRDERGREAVAARGGVPKEADLFDADALAHVANGCEVIVHAATAIPSGSRPKPEDFALNDRIRREGTRSLAECAARIGARRLVLQSIVWVAAPPHGGAFDETSPPHPTPVTASALDAERILGECAERDGYTAAALRCGWFYASDAVHTRGLGAALLHRKALIVGGGRAVWSPLHIDDAAAAFAAAVESDRAGLWHVVDDEPVTVREFLTAFAERLGAQPPRRVPVWLARLLAGRYLADFMTSSMETNNEAFRRDFDWAPRFPSYREGLDQVVTAWQDEGWVGVR